jgi:hypothetical protein
MISPDIMGSLARRLLNPITRCRDQPLCRYAGTDDGRGNRPKRLTKTPYADVRAVLLRITLSFEVGGMRAPPGPLRRDHAPDLRVGVVAQ